MTADLPKLNLKCSRFEPCKRTDKFPCNNCHDRRIILAHAAAYFEKGKAEWRRNGGTNVYWEFKAARDAVLELAGLTIKDLENKNGGD